MTFPLRLPGQALTRENRFARMLAQQPGMNTGTVPGGLAHMLSMGLQGLMAGRDARNYETAQADFAKAMAAPTTETTQAIIAAMQGGGNPYAAQLTAPFMMQEHEQRREQAAHQAWTDDLSALIGLPQGGPGGMPAAPARLPPMPTGNGDWASLMIAAESGGDPSAVNAASGATGLGQFLPATWNSMVDQHPELGLTYEDIGNPDAQRIMIGQAQADYTAALTPALGREPNNADLYMAHFFGPGAAEAVLTSDPSANLFDVLTAYYANTGNPNHPQAIRQQNAALFNRLNGDNTTVGDVYNWAVGQMGGDAPAQPGPETTAGPGIGGLASRLMADPAALMTLMSDPRMPPAMGQLLPMLLGPQIERSMTQPAIPVQREDGSIVFIDPQTQAPMHVLDPAEGAYGNTLEGRMWEIYSRGPENNPEYDNAVLFLNQPYEDPQSGYRRAGYGVVDQRQPGTTTAPSTAPPGLSFSEATPVTGGGVMPSAIMTSGSSGGQPPFTPPIPQHRPTTMSAAGLPIANVDRPGALPQTAADVNALTDEQAQALFQSGAYRDMPRDARLRLLGRQPGADPGLVTAAEQGLTPAAQPPAAAGPAAPAEPPAAPSLSSAAMSPYAPIPDDLSRRTITIGDGVTRVETEEEYQGRISALQRSDEMMRQVYGLLGDPNLSMITGENALWANMLPDSVRLQFNSDSPIPGLTARMAQLRGQAFLQAFETLKGGGQITQIEGQKATDAIARLSTAQRHEDVVAALRELEEVLLGAYNRNVPASARRSPAELPTSPDGQPGAVPDLPPGFAWDE